ncbi:glycosyltransferase family 2 protein [Bradyrhizobium sp.]|jgi:glycosyltransferase involved in cell wall biosynthesis|uniref:glycosyltransferase family 2 protein n=1 Tax=Bradyrhizobium sp. TaxID=376 RepID=UPI002DFE51C3|nr:glycosyltransferase family 2 protein [Bradyrhizobium sp.]
MILQAAAPAADATPNAERRNSVTRFSVVLAVRNGWPYVEECVESVLAQSYPHFDLIVLDNQSTDNTVAWLSTKSDSRIRLYASAEPLSIVESWGRVKDVEKHEYMTLIGHDDMLDPDFLATVKALIGRYPDAALYQTGSRFINSEGKTIRSCIPVPQRETAAQYLKTRFTFRRDTFGTGFVMRSADYDRIGGLPRFEKLFFADDALWLSLFSRSYKAADLGEHFSVRIHPNSESGSTLSAWPSILTGLEQFSGFLKTYIQADPEARCVFDEYGAGFMLTYHRNIYIFALVEASQAGRRIDRGIIERIETSLANAAPSAAGKLRRSPKVAAVEALNASPLRSAVPRLWNMYYRLKTRSR